MMREEGIRKIKDIKKRQPTEQEEMLETPVSAKDFHHKYMRNLCYSILNRHATQWRKIGK